MTFEDAQNLNFKLLDLIDIAAFMQTGDDINEVMGNIEGAYEDHEFSPEIEAIIEGDTLEGFIFNYLNEYDFMDYLTRRYGTRFEEKISYWISNIGQRPVEDTEAL